MSVKIVIAIGLILVAMLIGIDIYLATDSVKGNTWSEIIRMWSKHTTLVPWLMGILTGHFLHPYDNFRAVLGQPASIAVLLWLTGIVGILGLGFMRAGYPIPGWSLLIPAFIAGWLLWPI